MLGEVKFGPEHVSLSIFEHIVARVVEQVGCRSMERGESEFLLWRELLWTTAHA